MNYEKQFGDGYPLNKEGFEELTESLDFPICCVPNVTTEDHLNLCKKCMTESYINETEKIELQIWDTEEEAEDYISWIDSHASDRFIEDHGRIYCSICKTVLLDWEEVMGNTFQEALLIG